ncbi:MAG: hypothetical protein H5T80_05755 [Dietzia sp.]|nr:hypothetical protein [Dietzia sp.]
MIKKLVCVTVLATALLTAAPAAQAATAHQPAPPAGIPGGPLLSGLLGSLEVGHPMASPQSLISAGVLGG